MSDEATLAAQAVEYLGPYLQKAGAKAASKLGGAAADGALKLLEFLKDKLVGEAPRGAHADLEAAPADGVDQADVRKQMARRSPPTRRSATSWRACRRRRSTRTSPSPATTTPRSKRAAAISRSRPTAAAHSGSMALG